MYERSSCVSFDVFEKSLGEVLFDEHVASILDAAYVLSFRADSIRQDGNRQYVRSLEDVISKVIGAEGSGESLMESVLNMIAQKASR